MGYAVRKAPAVLLLYLVVTGVNWGVEWVSRQTENFPFPKVWETALSFSPWCLDVGLSAVFLRLIRTGEGRVKVMRDPWKGAGTLAGVFAIQVGIGELFSYGMSWMGNGMTMQSRFNLLVALYPLATLVTLTWSAFILFPVPYLLVDKSSLGTLSIYWRAWTLTSRNWGIMVKVILFQVLFMACMTGVSSLWVFSHSNRQDLVSHFETSHFRYAISAMGWVFGFFADCFWCVLYERLRLREWEVEEGAASPQDTPT